jgi:hypothetical protein
MPFSRTGRKAYSTKSKSGASHFCFQIVDGCIRIIYLDRIQCERLARDPYRERLARDPYRFSRRSRSLPLFETLAIPTAFRDARTPKKRFYQIGMLPVNLPVGWPENSPGKND